MDNCHHEAPSLGLTRMIKRELHELARAAGIQIEWRDVNGVDKFVSDESLRALLGAIGLPAESAGQIAESKRHLIDEQNKLVPLLTADLGEPVACASFAGRFKVTLENGGVLEGQVSEQGILPAVFEPGYHRLEWGALDVQLAVAPRSSYTLSDVAGGRKIWGLAVQLYALRRQSDGGIGDFQALAEFIRAAASHGADALAISPVHAQFSADLTRFGPYAPSNRAALNVLHVSEPTDFENGSDFVDWQLSGAARLKALRRSFEAFHDAVGLEEFRQGSGVGLERHAVFEAIQFSFFNKQGSIPDWRTWPAALQDPESAEVAAFKAAHEDEIKFQTYLQYRADRELGAARDVARAVGMKVGLIADLAVGTDQSGSHSWSRRNEILQDVEVGAPPDAINREGQSWGITAFSPRGLRSSGFSAFIEMLRHALRYAGGVRIDHVMGLARLWLIPHGCSSAEGAYLRMPVQDLMRLVRLESHRHKAIILGEDLGTLPEGFQSMLDESGIAGLRVLWFEKHGDQFKAPSSWSKSAVAMTSTHDLPTVAGWWRGQDIAWRDKLGMAGNGMTIRDQERSQLWNAMVDAGVTTQPMPSYEDGAAVADAACAFLGRTASTLALLPIEDALALPEQANLPGTVDEHPNWRRRLSEDTSTILDRPDVAARLAKLDQSRRS
jgi:4-alpha-glucanotransferase